MHREFRELLGGVWKNAWGVADSEPAVVAAGPRARAGRGKGDLLPDGLLL